MRRIRELLATYVAPPVFLCGVFALAFVCRASVLSIRDWVSPDGAWIEYYHSADFVERIAVRPLRSLTANYHGRPAARVRREDFFARIDSCLMVPATGKYCFASLSHDGIRLYVDGQLLIDNWRNQEWPRSGRHVDEVDLTKGFHTLRLDYFNGKGAGRFRVEWCGGPIPPHTIIAAPYLRKKVP